MEAGLKILSPYLLFLLVTASPLAGWWINSLSGDIPNNFPHIIAPLISACFMVARRNRIGAPSSPRFPVPLLFFSFLCLLVLVLGYFVHYYFLSGMAWIAMIFCTVRFSWDAAHVKHMNFPILFLFFALPWYAWVNQILGFELQLFSAIFAYHGYHLLGISAIREGIYVYTDNFDMVLEPGCSGLSYTFALLYTGVLMAALSQRTRLAKMLVIGSVIPVALLANGLRVFFIGLIGYHYGSAMAESVYHEYGGFLFFGIALLSLFAMTALVNRVDLSKKETLS